MRQIKVTYYCHKCSQVFAGAAEQTLKRTSSFFQRLTYEVSIMQQCSLKFKSVQKVPRIITSKRAISFQKQTLDLDMTKGMNRCNLKLQLNLSEHYHSADDLLLLIEGA